MFPEGTRFNASYHGDALSHLPDAGGNSKERQILHGLVGSGSCSELKSLLRDWPDTFRVPFGVPGLATRRLETILRQHPAADLPARGSHWSVFVPAVWPVHKLCLRRLSV